MISVGVKAQNVTISPNNGRMICAFTEGVGEQGQAGYGLGSFGTWIHEQLSLTMTGSNSTELTEEGLLKNHSNHFTPGDLCIFSPAIQANEAKNYISAAWGATGPNNPINPGYITIALPKGYRFTGYRFLLSHDITGLTTDNSYSPNTTSTFYMEETDRSFAAIQNTATIPAVSGNTVQVVEFQRTGDNMGNVLYFRTRAAATGMCELCFRYVELTFTADADASIAVTPSAQVTSGVSLLEMPFTTGKIDFGEITKHEGDRFSYIYNTVADMPANMLLYEYESTREVTAANSFDGTAGLEAYNKESGGSITTDGDYIKLNPGSSKEQVYILETPTYATMSSNGQKNPIQFRIVGANIEYTDGGGTPYDEFTMSFSYNNRTYYVNSSAQPTNNSSQAAKWFMDENGYLRTGTNGGTYLATGSYQIVTTTTNPGEAVACEFSNGYIVIKGTTNQYLRRFNNNNLRFQNNNGQRVTTTSTNTQATVGALSGGAQTCTLKVYGTDETTPVQTEEVKRSNNHGIIPLTGLNNDAIKFSVQGTGYVKLNVTLQALNPYIDQMTVVLNDTYNGKNIRQTRTFTADDFSVGGDTFKFYLPKECVHDPLTITFEDLYSKYGDETYNHTKKPGTSDSRYNYVKSQHYNAFNKNNDASTLDNNIYYNKVEAASSTLESARLAAANGGQYVRTKVGTVGNIAFRFNNADELATNTGYLTEYPFTLAKYRQSQVQATLLRQRLIKTS